jgi:hypothetical protein
MGCGDEETFDAAEFVAAANEHGAGLELGDELTTTEAGKSVHAIALEEPGQDESEPAADPHRHGAGSLIVTDDDAAALAEYERCEQTGLLVCFRAANVAVALEREVDPEQLAHLRRAIEALGDE